MCDLNNHMELMRILVLKGSKWKHEGSVFWIPVAIAIKHTSTDVIILGTRYSDLEERNTVTWLEFSKISNE
jgi:hypothetical protein